MSYSMPSYADGIKFKATMLTPERAQQLLDNNHPKNRKIKEAKITQMRSDIEEGNWKLTHEPIAVSDLGRLIDGQNRCVACIRADVAIPVYLCTGVPEDVMVAVDCGTLRNVADAARILGIEIKQVSGVSAVARRMAFGMTSEGKASGLSIQETLSWIESHRNAIQFAYSCLPKNITSITQASVRAVMARAYYRRPVEESRERVAEFCDVLQTGLPTNPKTDSAAIRLRNWLQDHFSRGQRAKVKGVRVSPLVVYAKTEIALEHFLNKEPIDSLRETSNELFWLPGEKTGSKEIQLAEETA